MPTRTSQTSGASKPKNGKKQMRYELNMDGVENAVALVQAAGFVMRPSMNIPSEIQIAGNASAQQVIEFLQLHGKVSYCTIDDGVREYVEFD